MRFDKPAKTVAEQLQILQGRGMIIDDVDSATHFLHNINYYRLGGYWYALQEDVVAHRFRPGTTFEHGITLYNFDRSLRLLLFDAIERIEVAVRTRLIYTLSLSHGPWWFEDANLFKKYEQHAVCLDDINREVRRSEEEFLKRHKQKYKTPWNPPSWKALEVVSFSTLSKLYASLKSSPPVQEIARSLHLPNDVYLVSWLNTFVVLRNMCAHHGRVYNQLFSYPPKTLRTSTDPWIKPPMIFKDSQTCYYQLSSVLFLLNVVSPGHSFKDRLLALFNQYPEIKPSEMGFPRDWQNEPLWR